jgi:tetratricopeptide (TPR) repeat protein
MLDDRPGGAILAPLSLIISTDLGWAYELAGQYPEALAEYRYALEMDPGFVPAHYRMWEFYLRRGSRQEAVNEWITDLNLAANKPLAQKIEEGFRKSGFPGALQAYLAQARTSLPAIDGGYEAAGSLSLLGRNAEAMTALEEDFSARDPSLIYVNVDPRLANLHSEPEFQRLIAQIGLHP